MPTNPTKSSETQSIDEAAVTVRSKDDEDSVCNQSPGSTINKPSKAPSDTGSISRDDVHSLDGTSEVGLPDLTSRSLPMSERSQDPRQAYEHSRADASMKENADLEDEIGYPPIDKQHFKLLKIKHNELLAQSEESSSLRWLFQAIDLEDTVRQTIPTLNEDSLSEGAFLAQLELWLHVLQERSHTALLAALEKDRSSSRGVADRPSDSLHHVKAGRVSKIKKWVLG